MDQDAAKTRGKSTRQFRIVVAVTILLLIVPIVVDFALHPLPVAKRLFAYAAPDTFYYLTVARNIGLHGHFSFDGEHLSNGYHPLWQLLTALPYALRLPRADSPWILAYLLAMGVALQSVALGFLARVFRRIDGSLSWLFAFMPAGAYAVCVSPAWLTLTTKQLIEENGGEGAQPVYGTWWSYFNGMETSLVLLFFAIILWLAKRDRPLDRPMTMGFALAGLVFARLDHALISLPILAGLCVMHLRQPGSLRNRLKAPAIATLVFVLPIVVYLIVNHVFVGSAFPVSGRLKSSFPLISADNFGFLAKFINHTLARQPHHLDDTWRSLQLVVPTMFALLTPFVVARFRLRRGRIVITWARPDPRLGALLLLVAFGVLWLTAYDFFFVYFYGVGHWYLPVSTVFSSLVCIYAAERIRDAWSRRVTRAEPTSRRRTVTRIARVAMPIATIATTLLMFFQFQRTPNYHLRFANFALDEGPKLRAFFANKNAKLIECDDGIVAWVSELPSMSGTGLGLDPEAARAKRVKPGLLPLAFERGYTYVTALVYVDTLTLKSHAPKDVLAWMRKAGAFTQLGELKDYDWSVAYRSAKRDFVIVQGAPRATTQKP